ncbi:unnamed protein product [Adineta ricciae]|uniref:NAD(P)(+)--arginine ADP-ribosyltransferase n=1 Tax=Adineta ricciae TaxID=249248 RepID=A0A816C5A5_ADIRI|nr:unnamed protein product [Adineta ricciae]
MLMIHNRFVNKTFPELQQVQFSFLNECQNSHVCELEAATKTIESIIPNVSKHVSTAKDKCNQDPTYLTWDESAAIYLYTMPSTAVFSSLNKVLRDVNRNARKPWLAYLKLLINALKKLPSTDKIKVWRGISCDCALDFIENDVTPLLGITSCSTDPEAVKKYLDNGGTLLEIDNCCGKNISDYSSIKDEQEVILMPGTRVRRLKNTFELNGYFILYLEEISIESLCSKIKQEYLQNDRIELIMNRLKSFPIDKSYINLTIVETKEQQEREKELMAKKVSSETMSIFEEIHRGKNTIEVKDIFARCEQKVAKIVVLGRAGIGKTTFCRFVAHQWAMGTIWERYGLVVLIRLRSLTSDRYSLNRNYMPIDLVEKEYFPCEPLSDEVRAQFKQQCDAGEVLWILDGYDEFAQNVPKQLADIFKYIQTKQHHILTSRPFMMNLAYSVQLEIIGFTDDNIRKYVHQFFNQIKDRSNDMYIEAQKLEMFLKSNPRMWGIAHIPVIVELICCIWCDIDWSETMNVTMTSVYDKMTEWICRRYLEKQNVDISQMSKEYVYNVCKKELIFLESLAFHGMQTNDIIIHPKLVRTAMKEAGHCLQDRSCLLNMGILKSLEYKTIGTRIETDKCHYFVHLSFQEHFAARYLLRTLTSTEDNQKKAIDFIRGHKYNQRFELVFNFICGLLVDNGNKEVTKLLWSVLVGKPVNLIGCRHAQLLISCLEETECDRRNPYFDESMKLIIKWIIYYIQEYRHPLVEVLRGSPSLLTQSELLHTFTQLVRSTNPMVKERTFRLLYDLPIAHPSSELIDLQTEALNDSSGQVKVYACNFFKNIRGEFVSDAIINKLMCMFTDRNARPYGSYNVSRTLLSISKKVPMNMMIDAMMIAMRNTEVDIRQVACKISTMWKKNTEITEIVNKLINVLQDEDDHRRRGASYILSQIDIETVSDQLLHGILFTMKDRDDLVRLNGCQILQKLIKKVPSAKVMKALIWALKDPVDEVRRIACSTLGDLGERVTIGEAISPLVNAVEDKSPFVRSAAYRALGELGEKAIINEVINCLTKAFEDGCHMVICSACQTIGKMGERVATTEILNKLTVTLGHEKSMVRRSASEALGKLGMSARTDEILRELVIVCIDDNNFASESAWKTLEQLYGETFMTIILHEITELLENANCMASEIVIKLANVMVKGASLDQSCPILCKLLTHIDISVRRSICRILGKFVNDGVTNEVIKHLILMLQDPDDGVKICAINSLAKISEETPTSEVSSALTKIFKNLPHDVINDGMELLRSLHKEWITAEVVTALVDLLKHPSDDISTAATVAIRSVDVQLITIETVDELIMAVTKVSNFAVETIIQFLLSLDKQLMTSDMFVKLITMLQYLQNDARENAMKLVICPDKQSISARVFVELVNMFKNPSEGFRKMAMNILLSIDKQLITPEMIVELISMHKDPCNYVRTSAAKLLMFLDDQSITAGICSQAVESVEDVYEVIEWYKHCTITRPLIETLMAKSITVLHNALKSKHSQDRFNACEAITLLNIDAVSMAVIDTVVGLLHDNDRNVRRRACWTLNSMGMKAARDEVINGLLDVYHRDVYAQMDASETIDEILPLIPSMAQLKSETVEKLSRYLNVLNWTVFKQHSVEHLVRAYFDTKIEFWLPIIEKICIFQPCCIIINGDQIIVDNNGDLVNILIPNSELHREMLTFFHGEHA